VSLQMRRYQRFDDATTREVRKQTEGPFAPFAAVYQHHILTIAEALTPGRFITIDESLINFYGRSKLKVFMACKPGNILQVESSNFSDSF
jgi:hypothetical protein